MDQMPHWNLKSLHLCHECKPTQDLNSFSLLFLEENVILRLFLVSRLGDCYFLLCILLYKGFLPSLPSLNLSGLYCPTFDLPFYSGLLLSKRCPGSLLSCLSLLLRCLFSWQKSLSSKDYLQTEERTSIEG